MIDPETEAGLPVTKAEREALYEAPLPPPSRAREES